MTSSNRLLADVQSFIVTFSRKFAIKRSLDIPPHLKRVATVPWVYSSDLSKEMNFWVKNRGKIGEGIIGGF